MADLVDAHLHLWDPVVGHDWLNGELRRRFDLADLAAELDQDAPVADEPGFILVEAARDGGLGEARDLLALIAARPELIGLVASLPDAGPAGLPPDLLADPGLLGVRTSSSQLETHPVEALAELAHLLAEHRLTWELNLPADQLSVVAAALDRTEQRPHLVLDHLAGHPAGELSPSWARAVQSLVERTTVVAKVSGLLTRSRQQTAEQIEQVATTLVDLVGAQRLILGSDWPVCTQVGSWSASMQANLALLARVAPDADPGLALSQAYPRLGD